LVETLCSSIVLHAGLPGRDRYSGKRTACRFPAENRKNRQLGTAGLEAKGIAMTDAGAPTDMLIQHVSELPGYSPPAHSGTVNRRLVGREFGAGFEMILGQVAPGGEASRHYHVEEAQIVYILKGEADVALGEEAPRRCGPGTVIRIPKGLAHEVVTVGDETLECLVLYTPPLGPHGFVEVPHR
jgi:quercetin dioxygenase-like cupin family protein